MSNSQPGLFRRLRESLRVQLLAWVVLPLVGVICVTLWTSYRTADTTADLVIDRMLLASARSIAEATRTDESGTIEAVIPPAALEIFDTGHADLVFYRVVSAWGRLVAGDQDLPIPKQQWLGETARFRERNVRTLMIENPIVGAGRDGVVYVTVATTLRNQRAMRRQLWLSDFSEQVALVLVAGIVVLIGLQRGLAPVLALSDAVAARGREKLDPLDPKAVQSELRPLVHALNDHMGRVQAQMAAQRRFIANAAHQLRTPLALLKTQASVAAREPEAAGREEALAALSNSASQATRLASQLLTLSRAEPGSRRPRRDRIDMAAAARQVLEAQAETALTKNIDLGLEAQAPVIVEGDGAMLQEMLVNLVDNALRYTQAGGTVTVSVQRDGDTALVRVQDDGPGIPTEERSHVFERFYRVIGTTAEGSGLGLAIVREVVDNAGGSVTLGSVEPKGLVVEVRLPAA